MRLMVPSVFARLPLGINSLAIVLYIHSTTHSFAIAGAATGASALGIGAGTALQGRLVDLAGTRLVMPSAVAHALFLGIVVVAAEAGLPAVVPIAAAFGSGLTVPPITSLLRVEYPGLFPPERPELLTAAYALDSMILDAVWVCGPLLVAGIASQTSAAVALGVSAVAVVAGSSVFLRGVTSAPRQSIKRRWRGAFASPGVITLTISTLSVGFTFGAYSVALPAFARSQGQIRSAGLLLSVTALSSIAATAVYGLRSHSSPLQMLHLTLTLTYPLAVALDALPRSIPAMAVLLIPTSCLVGPIIASRNELIVQLAVAGTETEAFSWPLAAAFMGTGIGAAIGGAAVAVSGWQAAILSAAGLAVVTSLLVAARRATLIPAGSVTVSAAVAPIPPSPYCSGS
jgi:predicted MFS family arabinose efflux permease